MINYWDIETGSLPEADLFAVMPIFEPAKNLKDPAKVAASIAEKCSDWFEKAALNAETGRVLAVGIQTDDGFRLIADDDESILINEVWGSFGTVPLENKWAGWNTSGFDLPFLVRRSWILRLNVPRWIRNERYFDRDFIDLMDTYSLGTKQYISLDTAARALGVGRKTGSGADFGKLWNGTAEQRCQAIDYLRNDLELTQKVGERIL